MRLGQKLTQALVNVWTLPGLTALPVSCAVNLCTYGATILAIG